MTFNRKKKKVKNNLRLFYVYFFIFIFRDVPLYKAITSRFVFFPSEQTDNNNNSVLYNIIIMSDFIYTGARVLYDTLIFSKFLWAIFGVCDGNKAILFRQKKKNKKQFISRCYRKICY